jgi:hypothetical protein
MGAAEFVIPRDTVLRAINEAGFSLALVDELYRTTMASLTAVCVQLALCAVHRCIALVCRSGPRLPSDYPMLFEGDRSGEALRVEVAINSSRMKYTIARGSSIPRGHFFSDAYHTNKTTIVRGVAPIPFANGLNTWTVDCEAMRVGNQLFGLCHADPPPVHCPDQLRLPL